MANHNSKDSLRRKAYLLKQLQTIYAWRGSLVDSVIQKQIIPKMIHHYLPSENQVLDYAVKLMDKQIAFGKEKKYLCTNITKSNSNGAYCAFYEVEYGDELNEEKLQRAKNDVIISLKNLLHSDFIKDIAKDNLYIIAQRELTFPFEKDVDISCTPDMIVFFKDKPPLIVDWKVHFSGNVDAWLQLGIYAIALLKTKPHRDFPQHLCHIKCPSSIQLTEYQLLKNIQRKYSISSEDIADIEDYIFESVMQMKNLVNGRKYDKTDANQFQTARSPKTCEKCRFKKLCWSTTSSSKYSLGEWL
jgi:hypothetical protein